MSTNKAVGRGDASAHGDMLHQPASLCVSTGLPADGTIAAEVAFMFNEWYKPAACLEFPRGGSQAIVNALVRCSIDSYCSTQSERHPPAAYHGSLRPLMYNNSVPHSCLIGCYIG